MSPTALHIAAHKHRPLHEHPRRLQINDNTVQDPLLFDSHCIHTILLQIAEDFSLDQTPEVNWEGRGNHKIHRFSLQFKNNVYTAYEGEKTLFNIKGYPSAYMYSIGHTLQNLQA